MKTIESKETYVATMASLEEAAEYLEMEVGIDKGMPMKLYVKTIGMVYDQIADFATESKSLHLIGLAAGLKKERDAAARELKMGSEGAIGVPVSEIVIMHLHILRDLEWCFYKDHKTSAMRFVQELIEEEGDEDE